MRRILLGAFLIVSLLLAGHSFVGAQSSTELITYNELNSLVSAGTLSATGASGCTVSGDEEVSLPYFKTCIHNSGSCASGQSSTYVPTYAAMLACKTSGSGTPPPTSAPTATPTATPTPAPHTTGIGITDSCITSTSDYAALSGDPTSPTYQANSVVTGSTCGSTGHQLTNGGAQQVLNGGSAIAAGTSVTVGADLYAGTDTVSAGTSPCTVGRATANASARVRLIAASGTIAGQYLLTGNGAWAYETVTVSIPSTGVYYIAIESQPASATATGSVFVDVHGGTCETQTATASAGAYVTGLTVSSS
jgi:hypothetical protein